jgi:hypothetical protein
MTLFFGQDKDLDSGTIRPSLKRPQAANKPQAAKKPQIGRKQAANGPQIGCKQAANWLQLNCKFDYKSKFLFSNILVKLKKYG